MPARGPNHDRDSFSWRKIVVRVASEDKRKQPPKVDIFFSERAEIGSEATAFHVHLPGISTLKISSEIFEFAMIRT